MSAASDIEMEETPWVTITFLITVVVAAFGYRFFGPEQPQFDEPIETTVCSCIIAKIKVNKPQ